MQSTASKSLHIAGEIKADHQRIDGIVSAMLAKCHGASAHEAGRVWYSELSPQLDSLKRQLEKIADAVYEARNNYGSTDTDRAQTMRSVPPSTDITAPLSPYA